MDIVRHDVTKQKRRRRLLYGAGGVLLVVLLGFGFSRLQPAAPTVDREAVWPGVVQRGDLTRKVRGIGTLVPEDIRWISAETTGQVERLNILPGAEIDPDTVILELTNASLQQEAQNAALQYEQAQIDFENFRINLEDQLLQLRYDLARLEADFAQARLDAEARETLFADGIEPELQVKQARLRVTQLEKQFNIMQERVRFAQDSFASRLDGQRAELGRHRARHELLQRQVADLHVKAGIDGILQRLPVEEGQQVSIGTNLAQVADPTVLKAVIRIPETQARDIQIGQNATVDTRNGIIPGRVVRIDPTVENGTVSVDVTLQGELPRGARADLTVEGNIELEVLEDVIYVARPAYGRENSTVGVFKFGPDGVIAARTPVRFGRSSVNEIEVLSGLTPGDRIILSDTSQWDQYDRIRVD